MGLGSGHQGQRVGSREAAFRSSWPVTWPNSQAQMVSNAWQITPAAPIMPGARSNSLPIDPNLIIHIYQLISQGCLVSEKMLIFSPVSTPIILYSEVCDQDDYDAFFSFLCQGQHQKFGLTLEKPTWPFGYGDLHHDNMPVYFRPLGIVSVDSGILKNINPSLSFTKLFLFDDGVGIIVTECNEGFTATSESDLTMSRMARDIFQDIFSDWLREVEVSLLDRNVPSFVYADSRRVANLNAGQGFEVYWSARSVISNSPGHYDVWKRWVNAAMENVAGGRGEISVGSGNSFLFESVESDELFMKDDLIRAMVFSQVVATMLTKLQIAIREDIRGIARSNFKRYGRLSVGSAEARLDHLDFIKLQYERAVFGFQGARRPLVKIITYAWNIDEQFENVAGWANIMKDRLSRKYRKKRIRQGRTIQVVLAIVGAASLIDVAISLIGAGISFPEDNVRGLLDLIKGAPADLVINVSLAFILVAAGIVTFVKKND